MDQLLNGLKKSVSWLMGHVLLVLTALSSLFFLLWRMQSGKTAVAEAKQVAAEQRGKVDEIKEETKQAEKQAADSRSEWERISKPHRGEGG